ncbi:hypothetical protein JKF63_07739 [Porcisia hertigi]|uniref:Uncharacterized protein n=1 Tax=Porcisia hertigi TaxID=2761500 RepID=A0A836LLQ1_9TRYP|nr:hypothetical protein JKF63_07739 [Porcisia hertigi]
MLPSRGVLHRGTVAATAIRWAFSPSTSVTRQSRANTKATTSRRRKRNIPPAPATTENHDARAGRDATASSSAAAADADRDVDEVERLLAITTTHATSAMPPPSRQMPVPLYPSSLLSLRGTTAAASDTLVDPGAALHFKALHQEEVSTRGRDGPTHLQLEQIDRRRSKPSLSEAEFSVGMTERLLPELPRLSALHEVHYGDAVVREMDRSMYFTVKRDDSTQAMASSTKSTAASCPSTHSATAPGDDTDEACKELSPDEDLSEESFAAFDAEAGEVYPTRSTAPAAVAGMSDDVSGGDALPPGDSHGEVDDEHEDDVSLHLDFGADRPWFVPTSGTVQLHPLSSQDCALLLRFLLHLRQQTEADLVPSLRRALIAAEKQTTVPEMKAAANASVMAELRSRPPSAVVGLSSRERSSSLTLAEVARYLETAPPPVVAFTESLPPNRSSLCPTSSPPDLTSPAFVFHLYLENTSSQNALGHLSALFGIPLRSLYTHTAVSKMSCSTVLCAVAENRVRREHLLLLNTLRHPGFVLRVSDIREVQENPSGSAHTEASSPTSRRLFRELAHWQPLYHTEILLRRVCSASSTTGGSGLSTRQQLEHRLRALQTVGAICFCANREASLARAATDVLHGFFRSALLNALQRHKAPVPLTRFLKRPNLATAQHAHHVSTDSTVRQTLKAFMQCNGDWHATVARTPYVWRRRWINALRGLVWNTMASERIRKSGREVCIGDVVLKRKYRDDVHRRGIMTVKAEHVMVVKTSGEAQAASMEDVFIPFLRGRYPEHLFADESTGHPIMTRTNMLALLRAMHAPQLLLGFTDEMRLLLDVRADVSPLLFRRLLVRPVELEFAIMEDKPPMRALHFDAARLLTNDRWLAAETDMGAQQQQQQQHNSNNSSSSKNVSSPTALPLTGTCHLIPPSEVLERTTLGARLASGMLSADFFSIPAPDDYVVLGHAHRHLCGDLVPAAPHSDTADVGDRVYSVYIRAVVEHNLAGLSNMLREYFVLSGIETDADSSLQHKVHRMRRELDPETRMLTAPVYCTTCYNRDHDTQEQCAEFQYKRHRRGAQLDVAAAALQAEDEAHMGAVALKGDAVLPSPGVLGDTHRGVATDEASVATTPAAAMPAQAVRMRWRLRRCHEEQRWGVHLTKALHLVGIENVSLLREAAVWCSATSKACDAATTTTAAMAMPDEGETCPWPSSWISQSTALEVKAPCSSPSALPILNFLRAALRGDIDAVPQKLDALPGHLKQSPVVWLPPAASAAALPPSSGAPEASELKACKWRLVQVNTKSVATQRDVAAALLTEAAKSREVWLTFEVPIGNTSTATATAAAATAAAEHSSFNVSTHANPGASDRAITDAKSGDCVLTASQCIATQKTSAMVPTQYKAEAAMQRALGNVSPEVQQWIHDLPFRVSIVLKKHRRDLQAHRSWGLKLDGADMTLLNFAKLLSQFMADDSNAREERPQGGGGCVSVASIAPGEAFPRLRNNNSGSSDSHDREVSKKLQQLLSDVESAFVSHVNSAYRLVRIQSTPVRHKADAARTMADLQASLDAQLASTDAVGLQGLPCDGDHRGAHANASAAPEHFFLTLTLERKPSSYRACSSLATAQGLRPAATDPSSPEGALLSANAPPSVGAPPQDAPAVAVAASFLSSFATEHCPVRPMTTAQLSRSVVTIAVNRLLLTSATLDKWGLRLQQGTRRLTAIQENRNFGFHVFAYKKSQGTRIADTLRLVPPSGAAATKEAATGRDTSTPVTATRAHHLYYVERVNRTLVRTHAELRLALHTAAQPTQQQQQQQQLAPGLTSRSALPPESVTLSVRQFPLLRLSATVRRGGVGEESALGPIGLQVDKRMQVVTAFADSPMARALDEAVGPGCSIRRLIRRRAPASGAIDNPSKTASEGAWDVVEDVQLRQTLARVVAAMSLSSKNFPGRSGDDDQSLGSEAGRMVGAGTTKAKKPTRRQWNYGMDEDTEGSVDGSNDTADTCVVAAAPVSTTPLAKDESAVRIALQDLVATAVHVQEQLGKLTMVDGVHLLQASMLQEYALTQLAKLDHHRHGSSSSSGDAASSKGALETTGMLAAARVDLAQLHDRLAAVHNEVRWEVVYAVESNRPLRTPMDLAAAFAPGVAQETVILQQVMED